MVGLLRYTLVTVFGLLLLAAAGLLLAGQNQTISAEGVPLCPSPTINKIVEPDQQNVVLSGVEEIRAFINIPSLTVDEVKFMLEPHIHVGLGERIGASNDWEYVWDTINRNNGPYNLYAKVRFTNGFECRTDHKNISIENQNTVSTHLEVFLLPGGTATFEPQVTVPIEVRAKLFDNASGDEIADVTENLEPSNITWATSIGTFTPNSPAPHFRNFFTGPAEGDGEIGVSVSYNGHNATDVLDLLIRIPTGGEGGGTSGGGGNGGGGGDSGTDEPIDETEEHQGGGSSNEGIINDYFDDETTVGGNGPLVDENGNPVLTEAGTQIKLPEPLLQSSFSVTKCLKEKLKEAEYQGVLNSTERLNSKQFKKSVSCFSARKFVIPASIAPVPPEEVKQAKEDKRLEIIDVENIENEEDKEVVALELTGTATPDSNILIYIFSEPLVLATTTDSDGNWSYTLEDPLEPGDHEAYVMVDAEEDGEYVRSSLFTFAVTGSTATDENPFGYGLALSGSANDNIMLYYILGSAFAVLIATAVLARFVWKKPAPQPVTNAENATEQNDAETQA